MDSNEEFVNTLKVSEFKRKLLNCSGIDRQRILSNQKEWMMQRMGTDPLAKDAYLWLQEAEAISQYYSNYEFGEHHIWITVKNHLKCESFMKFIDSIVGGVVGNKAIRVIVDSLNPPVMPVPVPSTVKPAVKRVESKQVDTTPKTDIRGFFAKKLVKKASNTLNLTEQPQQAQTPKTTVVSGQNTQNSFAGVQPILAAGTKGLSNIQPLNLLPLTNIHKNPFHGQMRL
jgi:hypothetical protein